MAKDEYIKDFSQLPSITGKDVIDLEVYAKLPRAETYKQIKAFLETARNSKEVRILFIVAEWGEGKTSIYEGLLKKEDVIKSDLVIPVSTKRLITHIKEKASSFQDTGSLGIRFFACLLYAIKDVIDNDLAQLPPFNKIKIKEKGEQEATIIFILNGLRSILNVLSDNSRVFIFIDEFEDIVDESSEIRSFIRSGLVEVINGYPRCLTQEPFAGRFHLLIAATPPAYERLSSEVFTDVGRLFGQRAMRVDLEKLDRNNAYNYILGVLKYCWKGDLPQIPFSEPGMFNAIFSATLGNPRSIINVVESLLTYVKSTSPPGKFKIIKPKDFVLALSDRRFNVYGGEINLLDKKFLSMLSGKLKQKCNSMNIDAEKCMDLIHLLISNLSPMSIEYIKQRIECKENCWDYINAIGEAFRELWNITQPFLYFKKVVAGMNELLHNILSSESHPNFPKVVDALTFYEYDQNKTSFSSVLFVPSQKLREISFRDRALFQSYIDYFTSFSPELSSESDLITLVDTFIFERVEKSREDYIMLSPAAINIFYPSPSIFFLDFIDDVDKRFKIGTNLMRNLTAYETEFHKGIINLLESGCKRVKINVAFESHNFRDVEVINLSYGETGQQYNLRTCIFSPLRIVEADFHNQIEDIIRRMKIAYIPLLMIFSWNPLPNEVKGALETHFISDLGKVFYYLDFPLTTIQCHQIIGYVLAHRENCKIREERWQARASRIINELKFEDKLEEFINNGVTDGYTLKPLDLEELRPSDIPEILRTLLVTDGNINERYNQLCKIEEKFRVYGRDFPISPKDIESKNTLENYVRELERNNIVKIVDGIPEVDYTPIEKRILTILREYGGSIQEADLHKLFVSPSDRKGPIEVYLKILTERKEIKRDKTGICSLRDRKMLDDDFKKLKEEISQMKKYSDNFPFGYLFSVKKRNGKAMIFSECVHELVELSKSIEEYHFAPDYEKIRVKRQIFLELLTKQSMEINKLLEEFYSTFSKEKRKYRDEMTKLKRTLEKLEESLNNFPLLMKNKIRIKEKLQLEEKERLIKELENKVYTSEEIIKEASELLRSEKEFRQKYDGFYKEFKGCFFFDVKILQLICKIKEAEEFMERCSRKIEQLHKYMDELNEYMDELKNLRESIQEHEVMMSSNYTNRFSSCLRDWIKKNLKSQLEVFYGTNRSNDDVR